MPKQNKKYNVHNQIILEFQLPFKMNDKESEKLMAHLVPALERGLNEVLFAKGIKPIDKININ